MEEEGTYLGREYRISSATMTVAEYYVYVNIDDLARLNVNISGMLGVPLSKCVGRDGSCTWWALIPCSIGCGEEEARDNCRKFIEKLACLENSSVSPEEPSTEELKKEISKLLEELKELKDILAAKLTAEKFKDFEPKDEEK